MAISEQFLNDFTRRLIEAASSKKTNSWQPEIYMPENELVTNNPKIKLVEIDERTPVQTTAFKPVTTAIAAPVNLDLGRISVYVNDPAIQDIESAGPGKPLIIKQEKGIQNTTLTLTEEEIQQVIKDMARVTSTPIQNNILRANYQGVECVGVISEFVGSRFIIHKKAATA